VRAKRHDRARPREKKVSRDPLPFPTISAAHAVFALLAAVLLWRATAQAWVADIAPDEAVAAALRTALPLASAAGSALLLVLGRDRPLRALATDAASYGALLVVVFALALGPLPRDGIGLLFVIAVVARIGPAAIDVATRDRGAVAAFLVALALYAPLAAWVAASAAPYGDQVHYLLAAERLREGSLDATLDAALFRELIGAELTNADRATHEVASPAGPRSVQGLLLPALLLPGWILGGRVGAHLVVALIAALVSAQLWLLLREAAPPGRPRQLAWLTTTFLAPSLPLATHVYPNALGALLGVAAYRAAFTRRSALPLAAGALLGATLLLTPRDGLLLLALAPFALRLHGRRFLAGVGAAAAVAIAVNAVIYGIPVPYAGYAFGTAAAQVLEREPSITFRFWVGFPAMLFDRTFGLAAVAPWAFLAIAGVVSGLRERRTALLPAAVAIAATLAVLSIFRYWEGGYAPPARYLIEVLPLAAPFLAYGIVVAGRWVSSALFGIGALATILLAAIPTAGLNSAFEHKLREQIAVAVGTDPLGWLPSFQPTTPDWYVAAYLRLVPALLLCAALVWLGRRSVRA